MRKITALFLTIILLAAGCAVENINILDFPDTRQSYDYSCGPGAVQSVMAYYGKDFRESQLIDSLKTDKTDGTLVRDIVKFFNSQGLTTDVKEHMTKNELFKYIDNEIPVIVLIQAWGKEADFNDHYRNSWNDGHFAVVIGYTDKDILFSDPAIFNTGYIPEAEFMERWHDYDEGVTKTYQLGIAVYGKEPVFEGKKLQRIR